MTKYIRLFFISLVIASCSDKNQITEFEKILGTENSETLTYLVSNFENDFLKKNYPNLGTEMAYHKFLTDLKDNANGSWKKTSDKSRRLFDNSNLKLQVYGIPDSVWIEKNPDSLSFKNSGPMIKIRRKFLKLDGTYQFGESESTFDASKNEDSIIAQHKKYMQINYYGKYRAALKSVAKNNEFIAEYLDMTEAAGIIYPPILAYEMLDQGVDYSNYFIKRLIVTEIVY